MSSGHSRRVGIGYDSHRFGDAPPLVLGGVVIPEAPALRAHSDGDAVSHAVTDALLGAAALGDIGALYPDTDPAYRGADSVRLLQDAVRRLGDRGFRVENVDITVIAERPRLGPHVDSMRARLASALRVHLSRVSVKGKTNEGMGFIGRGEGVAVFAVAMVAAGEAEEADRVAPSA